MKKFKYISLKSIINYDIFYSFHLKLKIIYNISKLFCSSGKIQI